MSQSTFNNGDTHLTARTAINNNANDAESRIAVLEALATASGFVDYADLATQTTPIAVTALGSPVKITNDGLGVGSNNSYLPTGVTNIWNTTTNQFDFTELSVGDMVSIRLVLNITTTTPNQNVDVDLSLAVGGSNPYTLPFGRGIARTSGVYSVLRYNGFYIGSADTLDNGGFFEISSDNDCDCEVVGWYCKITKNAGL